MSVRMDKRNKTKYIYRRERIFDKATKETIHIVVENKIDSDIRVEKGSQLDAYSEFCEQNYPQYNKLYILLSYREDNFKDIENSKKENEWLPMDYYSVFNVLLKYAEEDDFIKEYLRTLYFLLFHNIQIPNMHSSFSLFRYRLFINRVILKLN